MLLSDLTELKSGLVVAPSRARQRLFHHVNAQKRLFEASLMSPADLRGRFAPEYPVEMMERFGFSYDMGETMRPVFDHISGDANMRRPKIRQLADVREKLIKHDIYRPPHVPRDPIIYVVDDFMMQERLNASDPIFVQSEPYKDTDVPFVRTADKQQQAWVVFDDITALLDEGRQPADIRIVHTTADDDLALRKLFSDAGIPYVIDKPTPLIHHPSARRFLAVYAAEGFDCALASLNQRLKDGRETPGSDALAHLLDTHGSLLKSKHKPEFLRYLLKTTDVRPKQQTNAVTITSLRKLADDPDQTVFVMNAYDTIMPARTRDDDYLTDDEKKSIGMPTSIVINALNEKQLIHDMRMVNDIRLFWPARVEGAAMRPADLALTRPMHHETRHHRLCPQSHLPSIERLRYAIERHNHRLYGWSSPDFDRLTKTFSDAFSAYDYTFKPLSEQTLNRLNKRNIRISATSLTSFNECPFKFFLDHVMGIDDDEPSLPLFFGILSHAVMEKAFKSGFAKPMDVDVEAIDFPEDVGHKKPWFTRLFLEEQNEILNILQKREKATGFTTTATEHTFAHDTRLANVSLTGKIDRVMEKTKDDRRHVAVIDYKTGSRSFKDDDFERGKAIQLPFYLLMVTRGDASGRVVPYGFFYQPVNIGKLRHDVNNDPLERLLRLDGRILDDIDLFKAFYPEDALLGIRLKKDGTFAKSARVLSKDDMAGYLGETEDYIETCLKAIERGDYRIKPLSVHGNETVSPSCAHCAYRDICHHERRDWGDAS